jgi:hypothetical protein
MIFITLKKWLRNATAFLLFSKHFPQLPSPLASSFLPIDATYLKHHHFVQNEGLKTFTLTDK